MAPWWSVSSLTTSSVAVDVRCIRCHKKMSPPTERWPVWRCAHCWTEWAGPSDEPVPLHTRASRVEDDGKDDLRTAPHAGAGPKSTVSGDPEHVEEGNGHAVIEGRNGTLLLVEWRPARGVFRIGGLPDTQPPHPRWHEMSCIFRRSDVEWFPPGRENGHAVSVAAGP